MATFPVQGWAYSNFSQQAGWASRSHCQTPTVLSTHYMCLFVLSTWSHYIGTCRSLDNELCCLLCTQRNSWHIQMLHKWWIPEKCVIFYPSNQRNAWSSTSPQHLLNGKQIHLALYALSMCQTLITSFNHHNNPIR